ncbi:hypothetical protein KDA_32620 [Dictyobacter alpinus]|uniref:Uncharacterized protein n=1 Tax=Dictyobacter alpinus TaxID=2014873 RepID=A0A402B8U7_9CHLR|nr:hypothetical protein KDA_32620 [Dictyobacter alpinus]
MADWDCGYNRLDEVHPVPGHRYYYKGDYPDMELKDETPDHHRGEARRDVVSADRHRGEVRQDVVSAVDLPLHDVLELGEMFAVAALSLELHQLALLYDAEALVLSPVPGCPLFGSLFLGVGRTEVSVWLV